MAGTSQAPSLNVAGWHPRLQALYRYWCRIHPAEGKLPGRQHLDPADIPEYLPQLWLLDVQREPIRLRYRLVGTRIVEMAGRELTGLWLDEVHPHVAQDARAFERFQRVVTTGRPDHRRGRPALFLAHQADFTEIENTFFPFARDGRTVDMIMVYSIFYRRDGKEF
jgi:hypothetical protein